MYFCTIFSVVVCMYLFDDEKVQVFFIRHCICLGKLFTYNIFFFSVYLPYSILFRLDTALYLESNSYEETFRVSVVC